MTARFVPSIRAPRIAPATSPSHPTDDSSHTREWPRNNTSIIRVAKVKSGKVHDVTPALRVDHGPAWDPEGKYLYFIATRDFNPVYDALQFDLSFPQAQRPFLVTLRSDVPSPFVPQPKPVHRDHDHHDHDHGDDKKAERPNELRIEIDFDGIAGRILGFPVDEGDYQQIVATKGRVFYTRFPVRGIRPAGRDDDEDDATGTLPGVRFRTAAPRNHRERCGRDSARRRFTHAHVSLERSFACDRRIQRPL